MTQQWNNRVIRQEVDALLSLTDDIEESFEKAVEIICNASGRIVCTGIGKSGHIAQKIAATLTSTGSPAFFMHPTEAAHGNAGAVRDGDVVFAFSRSGRAPELQPLFEFSRGNGVPIVMISENDKDSLAEYATVVLKMPSMKDDWGHAPTTSSIMQMAIADAVAVTAAERRGTLDDMRTISLAAKQPFRL
ncbi:MAG: SIS domain-containing protein [Rhodospirillales bacterium]